MEKTRQQQLMQWLKQQRIHARGWLQLSSLLGLISALLILVQTGLLASLLNELMLSTSSRASLKANFLWLLGSFFARALISGLRERVGFHCGQVIRRTLRKKVLDHLEALGPAWIQSKPTGSWATLLLEQIEDIQDYYARYLPQMSLAVFIPIVILLTIFPINWAAGLILLATAPLIPLFMTLVGRGAAEANQRNFLALSRLSGYFLDRLRGLETLRLFHRAQAETENIRHASEMFRRRTLEVLRLAFLSSAVLEFFASLSIAVVAVYFGFSYLGELRFGDYHAGVSLFTGFLVLMLAPEFFQPLRDLGSFYHAKAQAVGAADTLHTFLSQKNHSIPTLGDKRVPGEADFTIYANALVITAHDGTILAGPLSFTLHAGQRVALVGQSGAGKSSLIKVLCGFLPYQGSLTINGTELHKLQADLWQQQLAWVGQHPQLPANTIKDNLLSASDTDATQLHDVLRLAGVEEFLADLPQGINTELGDQAARLSVGQAQRIAVARALLKPAKLLLLDEPAASLDSNSERHVMCALQQASFRQTTLLVTHQLNQLTEWDEIWVMRNGQLIQQGCYDALVRHAGPFAQLLSQRQGEKAE